MRTRAQKKRLGKHNEAAERSQPDTFSLNELLSLVRMALVLPTGIMLGLPGTVLAGPQGGQVVGGQGAISTPSAGTTLINQHTQNLAIQWQKFNLSSQELVRFQQPSASAAVLNRILDQQPSQIFGAIEANGRVFLANPHGMIFGPNARIQVGSLVAAGMDMQPARFMEGQYDMGVPEGINPGIVVNRGIIQAATGGSVTLVGGSVSNEGMIVAELGYVNLASGRRAVLDFDGNGLIRFQVDESVLENPGGMAAAVSNSGEIRAEGGTVILSANTARDIFSQVVNNEGVIRAGRIDNSGGVIRLTGTGGPVANSGLLDASGTEGGSVSIRGDSIEHSGSISVDAGDGSGGRVELIASDTSIVSGNGTISASSASGGAGGSIHVLGDKVGLFEQASLDASGASGGGEVLIGGDYQGNNPNIRNASRTYLSPESGVKADAMARGDGGRVIVWADESTQIFGSISARGGTIDGDGGFVETSSKNAFRITATPDVGASHGNGGTWLIDPFDIEIVAAQPVAPPPIGINEGGSPFESSASSAKLFVDHITDALTGGANVIVRTGAGGAQDGNITLTADLDYNGKNDNTLTFQAHNDIIINGQIHDATPGGDSLNLILTANTDSNVNGGNVNINNSINLGVDGSFTSSGWDFTSTAGSVNAPGGIEIDHEGGVAVGALNAGSSDVTLNADGLIADGGVIIGGLLTTSSIGGTILDEAHEITAFNATNTTSGNVVLNELGGVDITGVSNGVGDTTITSTGAISDSGAIVTGLLTTSSAGGTILDEAHQVTSFNATNVTNGNV
ncbi:MAG: filamentous hemagglutinin N-terminal domain-containing protein, partial [Gammaproteobacteria bacterium]|nr:filamentous hemagglutinin N-terminal domain-containing protein [Gammaproteobacteria bacterium]